MRVVVLAGGLGSRLAEVTETLPKPMVEIGGHPLLWHILKHYSHFGFDEFAIALGYKGEVIKRYFLDYNHLNSSFTLKLGSGEVTRRNSCDDDWTVHLIDTGVRTMTGGRLKRMAPFLADGTFMMTYGDGVTNIDLRELVAFHRRHGKLATITAVHPPGRFGNLVLPAPESGDRVLEFAEKPLSGDGWINGGYFVLEPGVLDYIAGDETIFEQEPLERLAAEGQLMAYRHRDFWQCMDTLRDVRFLESLWSGGQAPWKTWD
jgi:glucose-1-phosphate cytidylyltransferase